MSRTRRQSGPSHLLVLLGIVILLALAAFTYRQVLSITSLFFSMFNENTVLLCISLYLIFFLCLVVLRYLAMIGYSFMEHLAYLQGDEVKFTDNYQRDDTLPLISLIVPAYNEALVIQPALRNLLELDYPDYEIILVDDGSTDDTFELGSQVARESVRIKVRVVRKANGGKADALNTGIAMARGEFIVCMDGDTKLASDALRAMIRHFDDPRVGAVAGNVKVFNRENLLTRLQALEYVEGLAMVRRAQSFMRSVNIIPGPCGMFRKSVLRAVGSFDSNTFAEDYDLTVKILLDGWHVAYEPMAIAWVETPSHVLDLTKQRYRWTRGILQVLKKHKSSLWHPRRDGAVTTLALWFMIFEGVLWPISNVLGNLFLCYVGLNYGVVLFVFYWWLQLTLLDVIAAAYCVIIEKEQPSLIPYAVIFRIFYILVIDIGKVLAMIEEWSGSRMTWGKLQREGKLS
jgi:poly-beta-1,6 N-acetyl-D-glucosamine synthase